MATIREMRIEDLDVIYNLECLLFKESAWPKETLKSDMEMFEFDVLEVDGEIVGYCSLSLNGDFADVLNIGVHPNHRRQGYGSLLMKHMSFPGKLYNFPIPLVMELHGTQHLSEKDFHKTYAKNSLSLLSGTVFR